MRAHVSRRWLPAAAVAAAGILTAAMAGVAAADTASADGTAGPLPRPAADRPDQRGADAPIGRVVPGLTGAAAQRAAGAAGERFRTMTAQRASRIGAGTAASGAAVNAGSPAAEATRLEDEDLHTAWGTLFSQSKGQGIKATHSVFTGAAASTHGGDVVYAPTALAPGGACMEMTTAYTSEGPRLWAWDWCGGTPDYGKGIGKIVTIDSTFLSTYTTTVNGQAAFSTDVHQTNPSNNTWTGYLYNFQTHAWDIFFTSSGTYNLSDKAFGWDIFEIYSTVNPATNNAWYCASMNGKKFDASSIEVNIGGTWSAATPNTTYPMGNLPSGSAFECPSLKFTVVNPNDHWTAQIGASATGSTSPR